jgi:hypothetical protein
MGITCSSPLSSENVVFIMGGLAPLHEGLDKLKALVYYANIFSLLAKYISRKDISNHESTGF